MKMLSIFNLFAALFFISIATFAQREINRDIYSYINNLVDAIPSETNSDLYRTMTPDEIAAFEHTIAKIIEKKFFSADSITKAYGYELFKIVDNSGFSPHYYYALIDKSNKYWGSFVFNSEPRRSKLIIQCPHSVYDSNTGYQGAKVFAVVQPYAIFLNGVHRCNSTSYSNCSGATSACSNQSESYRASDQAHNINNSFQAATRIIEEKLDSTIYIQLHGFSKASNDPYLIMSNGVRIAPAGADYLQELRNNLSSIDPELTFKIPYIDTDWTRLIATTNTQGRLINGSELPCTVSAAGNAGRFIHIEQERTRLRASEEKWMVMAEAIDLTFPEDPVVSVEIADKNISEINLQCFPNPFNGNINISLQMKITDNITVVIYNILAQKVKQVFTGEIKKGTHKFSYNSGNLSSGLYFVTVVTSQETVSRKILLAK